MSKIKNYKAVSVNSVNINKFIFEGKSIKLSAGIDIDEWTLRVNIKNKQKATLNQRSSHSMGRSQPPLALLRQFDTFAKK